MPPFASLCDAQCAYNMKAIKMGSTGIIKKPFEKIIRKVRFYYDVMLLELKKFGLASCRQKCLLALALHKWIWRQLTGFTSSAK